MHPLCKILNTPVMSICLVKQNEGTWVEKHQRFLFNVYKRFFFIFVTLIFNVFYFFSVAFFTSMDWVTLCPWLTLWLRDWLSDIVTGWFRDRFFDSLTVTCSCEVVVDVRALTDVHPGNLKISLFRKRILHILSLSREFRYCCVNYLHCALASGRAACVCVCGSVTTITWNCLHRSSPNWVCR